MLVASASAFGPLAPTTCSYRRYSSKVSTGNSRSRIRLRSVPSFFALGASPKPSDDDPIIGPNFSKLSKPTSKTNSAFSRNEFSRILYVDRIFRKRTRIQNHRDHDVTVKADASECRALAKRFDLKGLTRLEAQLTFRPAAEGLLTATDGNIPVEAEGTIEAHLTQKCIRTNEEFDVDMELPIYAVIKPVESNNDEDLRRLFLQQQEKKVAEVASGCKKKDYVFHENKQKNNLADIFDLQAAIQEADFLDDSEAGTADLVEDEAIYSFSSEQLDVGELIAQTFWLELDPYPKKPGSDPVSWEISG